MTKSFRHVGVLMMVAIVALGALGAAYTLWYEDLELHANVSTGSFDADWSLEGSHPVASLDEGENFLSVAELAEETGQPPEVIATKLPRCDAKLGGTNPSESPNNNNGAGTEDLDILTLTLGNLYPYAGCAFWIDVHNDGTVPMHMSFVEGHCAVDAPAHNCSGALIDALVLNVEQSSSNVAQCQDLLYEVENNFWGPDPVVGGARTPLQLHANEHLWCHFTLTLPQLDIEGDSVRFILTYRTHQWNENAFGNAAPEAGSTAN